MVIEAGSAAATLTYDSDRSKYTGSLALPVGSQRLSVKAYAAAQLVGLGTADVTIVENQTTAVSVRVLDTTGGQVQPDAGPFIISLTSSSTSPVIGVPITLQASAADANGDPISYEWASTCGGSFSPAAESTTWLPGALGACKITVKATSKSLSDSESIDLFVFAPNSASGAAAVDAEYEPNPVVYGMGIGVGNATCQINAQSTDSMCPNAFVAGTLDIYPNVTTYGQSTLTFTDNCGGSFIQYSQWYAQYAAPRGLCTVTATVKTLDGLTSSLSASLYVK